MKIAYYGYRDWAMKIFTQIEHGDKYLITNKDYNILDSINPDVVFFIGWSYLIPQEIIDKYTCICLHPSPLPKYRGGSPIQHQIINGEITSAVSLFIMDEGIDTGDILYQGDFSLEGTLDEIFDRIVEEGVRGIRFLLLNYSNIQVFRDKQDDTQATSFRRRKPQDSEITLEEITNNEPEYLYNKIRSLNDPYPNAYIKCKDGKKLFIITSKIEE